MIRARALGCILSGIVVFGGCGKDEPRGAVQEPVASSAPAPRTPESPESSGQSSRAVSPEQASVATGAGKPDSMAIVRIAELPRQAAATLRLIEAGGPFPYEKDGVVFGNRERMLPRHPRGYYHEYTVPTPRSRDRGARRIVCGGAKKQTGNCYYTDDHYASFKRIAE